MTANKIIKASSPEASSIRTLNYQAFSHTSASHAANPLEQHRLRAEAESRQREDAIKISRAEQMLRQAEQMLNEARRKAEEIEREAYQRGFEQGEKAGAALGQQKLEPTTKAFAQMVEELASWREQLLAHNEEFVLKMGFLAAGEILHGEITLRPEAALDTVRAALDKVIRGAHMRLRVSPHDYELIKANMADLLKGLADRENFSLESDSSIARGGCFLTTESGDIDAQIDHQLAILKQRLLSEK
ncbi:MAG: Yop proteins translocation protein L [candidate division BRC1 bacterium ADurb.BinA364]|nr:MAG: Yop proteins translocation protein L [candidate division BRC1 bacterium ADurb.BinA364]